MSYKQASENKAITERKGHHVEWAMNSQVAEVKCDRRFTYEPFLSEFPRELKPYPGLEIAGRFLKNPIWISSMTGGFGEAGPINQNLAKAAREYGLGMGLGSCRPLLTSEDYFSDFALRAFIGPDVPLFANFGMAQMAQALQQDKGNKIIEILKRLEVDGVFIHINPLQEWFQPEGDRWNLTPLIVCHEWLALLEPQGIGLGVKEVGQGMGPESLEEILKLPLTLFEMAAFGGTNFSYLESLRHGEAGKKFTKAHEGLCYVGHSATEMVSHVNCKLSKLGPKSQCKAFVISGGISSYLDGFYLLENMQAPAAYGMAKNFLAAAQSSYDDLQAYVETQIQGLALAKTFLRACPLSS